MTQLSKVQGPPHFYFQRVNYMVNTPISVGGNPPLRLLERRVFGFHVHLKESGLDGRALIASLVRFLPWLAP